MVVAVRQLYLTYTQQRVSACIDEVHSWMQSNRLQVNINKSELLWCATARRQHQLPTSKMSIQDWGWYQYHHSVNGCSRSRYLYVLWSQHADACPAVCRRLLCSPASATQHSSICSVVQGRIRRGEGSLGSDEHLLQLLSQFLAGELMTWTNHWTDCQFLWLLS